MTIPGEKLSLKQLVDTKRNKVLFAEAVSDFVDVLFAFLTLPVGTIIRQLDKYCGKQTNALGCLNNLYASVGNLSSSNFSTEECKLMLLNPNNASEIECMQLKLRIDSEPTLYYQCPRCKYKLRYTFEVSSLNTYEVSCSCGHRTVGSRNEGVFTATKRSFLITDDLHVMPIAESSNFEFLRSLVSGADVTEELTLSVGLKEIIHLLKMTFLSRTPLTNFFQQFKSNTSTTIINPEQIFMSNTPQQRAAEKTDVTMELKALVQKSNRQPLLFLAGDDFINFVFTILTIPLGSVVSLLDGKICIKAYQK